MNEDEREAAKALVTWKNQMLAMNRKQRRHYDKLIRKGLTKYESAERVIHG